MLSDVDAATKVPDVGTEVTSYSPSTPVPDVKSKNTFCPTFAL